MSVVAYRAVWTRSRAKGAAHHALLAFAEFADDDGLCWPSAATIAERLQIDERNARVRIAALVAAGELIPVRRGRRSVVVYRIACLDTGYAGRQPLMKTSGVTPDENITCRKHHLMKTSGEPLMKTSGEPLMKTSPEPSLEPSGNHHTECEAAIREWNLVADECRLAPVQKLTAARRSKLAARLAEAGLDGWRAALAQIRASRFLCGEGDNGWRCSLDWLAQETNFAKVGEGAYADKPGNGAAPSPTQPVSPPKEESDPWVLEDGTIVPDSEFDQHLDENERIAHPLRRILTPEQFRALNVSRKTAEQCRELVAQWTNGLDGA